MADEAEPVEEAGVEEEEVSMSVLDALKEVGWMEPMNQVGGMR
jgi:hypothetical protein